MNTKLYNICKKVRENFCKNNSFLWEDDLAGCCCEISQDLFYALIKKSFKAKIIQGKCYGCFHHWIECKGYFLDLSIKQFESLAQKQLPEIFISKIAKTKQYKKEKIIAEC